MGFARNSSINLRIFRNTRTAKKTKFESLMLHFRYIEHLTRMRDIFRSYGMNQAADNLDNDIKKLINDLKI